MRFVHKHSQWVLCVRIFIERNRCACASRLSLSEFVVGFSVDPFVISFTFTIKSEWGNWNRMYKKKHQRHNSEKQNTMLRRWKTPNMEIRQLINSYHSVFSPDVIIYPTPLSSFSAFFLFFFLLDCRNSLPSTFVVIFVGFTQRNWRFNENLLQVAEKFIWITLLRLPKHPKNRKNIFLPKHPENPKNATKKAKKIIHRS